MLTNVYSMNVLNKEATGFQETVAQKGQEREGKTVALGVTHPDQTSRPLGKSERIDKIDDSEKRLNTKEHSLGPHM